MDQKIATIEKAERSQTYLWIRRLIPVIISGAILYYYFHDHDWGKLWEAAAASRLWLVILALLIPQLVFWYVETYLQKLHFDWFHGPISFWDLFWVRGAIYILMFVNTLLGGGGMLVYLQRKADISWKKLMGIALFRVGLFLWGLSVIMIPGTLALYHYDLIDKAGINMYVWWGFLIFGVVYLVNGWMTWHHGTHFGISKFVVRDRNSEFWTAFRLATKKQWFITWALIIPPFLFSVLGFYFVALAFDVHIPFIQFMVVGPLMVAVMDLPIAVGNFGTSTMAWMIFFESYSPEATVLALTLLLAFIRSIIRSLIGLISLRPALRDINNVFSKNGSVEPG